jgi:hypothetical protein
LKTQVPSASENLPPKSAVAEVRRDNHKGKMVEVHERLWDKYCVKQTKPHHLKLWEQAMKDDSLYRKRAAKLGPDVERLIIILLQQGQGFIDTRKIKTRSNKKQNINRILHPPLVERQSYGNAPNWSKRVANLSVYKLDSIGLLKKDGKAMAVAKANTDAVRWVFC